MLRGRGFLSQHEEKAWNHRGSGLGCDYAPGKRSYNKDSFWYGPIARVALTEELLGLKTALCGYLLI
ncbi:hypothetical protein F3Y30_01080 [Sinorhizobium sp. BG8]|nr:hypothetical protein F3Y30_01080 [Sinorhizobium sp. BG8]